MKSIKKGFTLVELLVVLAVLGIIMAAFTTTVTAAQERARKSQAETEVKMIHQAILAYENYQKTQSSGAGSADLETMTNAEVNDDTLDFLFGGGFAESGKMPSLLQAKLSKGGKMLDPWGIPYTVSIKKGANVRLEGGVGAMETGYHLPNFYRLSPEERK